MAKKRTAQFPKPDDAYIRSLITVAQREFCDRDLADSRRDEMYWQENLIEHPAHVDFQEVHMGLATDTIERIRGILDEFPNVQVSVLSLSEREGTKAEAASDFLNQIFPALMDDQDMDTWDDVIEDVARFGRGYDQLLYIPSARSTEAADFPTRDIEESDSSFNKRMKDWQKRGKLPLVWRHLPARGVFAWRDEDGISECLIVDERRARDVLNRYDGLDRLREQVTENPELRLNRVFFVEYWSRKYGAYWVSDVPTGIGERRDIRLSDLYSLQGSIATVFDNFYGFVPLIETPGITSTSRNSAKHHQSVIDHMAPLSEYLDTLASQAGSAIRQWAWATPYTKSKSTGLTGYGVPVAPDERPDPTEIVSGKLNHLMPDEELGWFVPPDIGAGADKMLTLVMHQADTLGISTSMFSGSAISNNGYLFNSTMNAIRSKLNPVIRHIKRAHKQRCQQLLRIIELHGEPLWIFKPGDAEDEVGTWLSLDPRDIKKIFYNLEISYEDHLPTDDASDVNLALQTTNGEHPLMDRAEARRKFLRDKSPLRTEKRVLIQKLADQPPIQEFLTLRAITEAKLLLDGGGIEEELKKIPPQELAMLPPSLLQVLQQSVQGQNPSSGGGIPSGQSGNPQGAAGPIGAPQPYQPGINRAMVPPPRMFPTPPRQGINSANAMNSTPPQVRMASGRPPGMAAVPPRQPMPRMP